jgi:hypothetical protein
VQVLLEKASERFPQFEEHARFLSVKTGGIFRFGGLVSNFLERKYRPSSPVAGISEETRLTREEFAELLKTIDLGLRGLPATAQVGFRACPSVHDCCFRVEQFDQQAY